MVVGLCGSCRHHRWITSGRGSRFLRCELAKSDPRFDRYPPLPMLDCPGYETEPEVEPEESPDDEAPDADELGGEG